MTSLYKITVDHVDLHTGRMHVGREIYEQKSSCSRELKERPGRVPSLTSPLGSFTHPFTPKADRTFCYLKCHCVMADIGNSCKAKSTQSAFLTVMSNGAADLYPGVHCSAIANRREAAHNDSC